MKIWKDGDTEVIVAENKLELESLVNYRQYRSHGIGLWLCFSVFLICVTILILAMMGKF